MPRLFIAFDTPPVVLPLMTAARDRLRAIRSDVKWEPDDKLHCTLKFLGDTPPDRMDAVSGAFAAVARATEAPMATYEGLGCFPNMREPRIVWAGIRDPEHTIAALATAVDVAAEGCGFERERRRFHPHVTLGRVKGQRGLRELLATLETITFVCPPVQIQEIVLVRSELRPTGSVYTVAARFPLGTGGGQ